MTITDTTTLGQSGPGNNGYEGVTPHSPKHQDWSLTTRCRLVPYLGLLFLRGMQIDKPVLILLCYVLILLCYVLLCLILLCFSRIVLKIWPCGPFSWGAYDKALVIFRTNTRTNTRIFCRRAPPKNTPTTEKVGQNRGFSKKKKSFICYWRGWNSFMSLNICIKRSLFLYFCLHMNSRGLLSTIRRCVPQRRLFCILHWCQKDSIVWMWASHLGSTKLAVWLTIWWVQSIPTISSIGIDDNYISIYLKTVEKCVSWALRQRRWLWIIPWVWKKRIADSMSWKFNDLKE